MKALILSIGDELLIGQVINTNAAFIAQKLNSVGIEVVRVLTVGDTASDILAALKEGEEHFDVTAVTGGLGPTHDDITRKVICTYYETDLVTDPAVIEDIKHLMEIRNFQWSKAAEEQALVPRIATVIRNKNGTAPGYLIEKNKKYCIVMPGVPYEMEAMMDNFVVPYFREHATGKVVLHRTIKTTGIAESILAGKLGNVEGFIEDAKLAFLPSPSGVRLRITVVEANQAAGEEKIRRIESRIRAISERYIYGTDEEELEEIIQKLLIDKELTLGLAESCTGGLIANRLTNISGSSRYFRLGLVTYSNDSKTLLLGVPAEMIQTHGAVSRPVAEAMAKGVRDRYGVDLGISTTGIAGPTGGTPEKPVGLVWIGFADAGEVLAVKFQLGDHRLRVKERASQAALELLRRKLLKIE